MRPLKFVSHDAWKKYKFEEDATNAVNFRDEESEDSVSASDEDEIHRLGI